MAEQEQTVYRVKIEGTSPLKMHKFCGKEKPPEEMEEEKIAEMYAYRLPNGNLGFPGEWLYGALVNAARMTAPKMSKKQTEEYVAKRVRVRPAMADLGIKSYEIDRRVVKNYGRGGTNTEIAIKPRIDRWSVELIVTTTLPKDELERLLKYAGENVGVGNDTKHGYGLFKLLSLREEEGVR